jgi:peroxiredoxin
MFALKSMKKILFSIIVFLPSVLFAQSAPDLFSVSAHFSNLNPQARAYLLYQLGANKVIDSAMNTNGDFNFDGKILYPVSAYLVIDHTGLGIAKIGNAPDILNLYLEKGSVSVFGKDSVTSAKVSGSVLNDENTDLQLQLKPLEAPTRKLYAEMTAAPADKQNDPTFRSTMMARGKAIQDQQKAILKKFVLTHPDSYLSLFTINLMGPHSNNPKELFDLFNTLSPDLQDSEPGKSLKSAIDRSKITGIGATAPDFTQDDVNGKPVTLSSFRGKYVLIDFWASWCGPCRQENPNLVKTYNKYKDKNFTVLGVSLDRPDGKADWLKAIKNDGLVWTQVSDLNFWSNKVAVLYFIGQIPSNFLLDPNGKIIARDLRGTDLDNKLEEILGKI